MNWEAVLLAGGKLEEEFVQSFVSSSDSAPSKAYLDLHGKKMADYVLDVLKSIPRIRRIVSVIPAGAPGFPGTDPVPGGNSLIESLSAGFHALAPETDMALVATSDIPCLTVEGTEDFMRQCEEDRRGTGLFYSMVSRDVSENKYPGIPHTYVRLRDGSFCGGGLFSIAPKNFPALRNIADTATRNRKNVIALARIFGVSFIIRLLFRRLSVADLEKRGGEILGFPARGILSNYPEIAFNIDDPTAFKRAKDELKQPDRVPEGGKDKSSHYRR